MEKRLYIKALQSQLNFSPSELYANSLNPFHLKKPAAQLFQKHLYHFLGLVGCLLCTGSAETFPPSLNFLASVGRFPFLSKIS